MGRTTREPGLYHSMFLRSLEWKPLPNRASSSYSKGLSLTGPDGAPQRHGVTSSRERPAPRHVRKIWQAAGGAAG